METQTLIRGSATRGVWATEDSWGKGKADTLMRRGRQGERQKDLVLHGGPTQDHARQVLTSFLTSNLQENPANCT